MGDTIPQIVPQGNSSHTKYCSACHLWLPLSRFGFAKTTRDGLHCHCKTCHVRRTLERMTPEKARDRNYRTNYGITAKQYDRMLAQQNGVCACCGEPETDGPQGRSAPKMRESGKVANLAVDHDHKTGDVRALLCGKCNKALGIMMEDPERIQKLKEYAEWCQQREPDKKIIQLRLID